MKHTSLKPAEQLRGPERAAVIMLALGEEASRSLWETLDDEELREITIAISRLGSVTAEMVESLLLDFVDNFSQTGPITGSVESARRLLSGVLPREKIDTILEEIKGPAGRTMWDKLGNVSPITLARYLAKEHPQTVAVILSRIKADHAALVITAMPPMMAEETINRMLSLGPVQRDVLEEIEKTLRTEFLNALTQTPDQDTHEVMAEIFNNFDRQTERHFMGSLEDKNPDAASQIKSLMFVFDNLINVDGHDIQLLLRHVDKSVLAVALKGASDEVKAHFLGNMSERAAKILQDDIAIMRPLRVREVDGAQQKIVEIAKRLSDEDEIYLTARNEEEVIY